jgi:hypothetical protein
MSPLKDWLTKFSVALHAEVWSTEAVGVPL